MTFKEALKKIKEYLKQSSADLYVLFGYEAEGNYVFCVSLDKNYDYSKSITNDYLVMSNDGKVNPIPFLDPGSLFADIDNYCGEPRNHKIFVDISEEDYIKGGGR